MIEIYKSLYTETHAVRDYTNRIDKKTTVEITGSSLENVLNYAFNAKLTTISRARNVVTNPQPLTSYYLIHEFKDWDEVKSYYPEYFI